MYMHIQYVHTFTFLWPTSDMSCTISTAGTVPVKLSVTLFVVILDELAGLIDTSIAIIHIYVMENEPAKTGHICTN